MSFAAYREFLMNVVLTAFVVVIVVFCGRAVRRLFSKTPL